MSIRLFHFAGKSPCALCIASTFSTNLSAGENFLCEYYEKVEFFAIFALILRNFYHTIVWQVPGFPESNETGVKRMLNVVLVEPEIPQNCGNIARTCAATGCTLHLIRPLGFDISEKAVKRAGLDYWDQVTVKDYVNLEDFFAKNDVRQMWCLSTKAPKSYTEAAYEDGCYLFFGKETKGLPETFLAEHYDSCVRIPMRQTARSLNLSNAVAITVFEALRQLDFPNLQDFGKMRK